MIFSVVIPAYNRSKVLERAVNSVLHQTFQDFEIIVVDDGSTDNTKDVVEGIKDSRIKYVWQSNQGATAARNAGVKNAEGKYVSFLDSDDAWYDLMLEKQLQSYNEDAEIGCVYSDLEVMEHNGKCHPFSKPLGQNGNSYKDILSQGYMAPTSVLSAKRDVLIAVGMFDENLPASQDDDICFKLAKHTKVRYIPDILAKMYVGQSNRISINFDKVARGWWMLWNKYENDVLSNCGEKIMAKHYMECLHHFVLSGDRKMALEARRKCEGYGGTIGTLSSLCISLGLSNTYFRDLKGGRVLRKLLKWSM